MVFPVLPLVIEDVFLRALLLSSAVTVYLRWQGWSSFVWVPIFLFLGILCRIYRAFKGPFTSLGGRCSREDYASRVEEVKEVAKQPGPLRMFKKTASNTFRPAQIASRDSNKKKLDLSSFVHVLEVNVEELWCDIEASATFETYVSETLPLGVAPLVVPELRTITVGGAIVGIGIESSSFKHGFHHESLLEADVLLASGEVVTVRPDNEHAALFRALPNSLGSFGYLLRLRLRVQRSKPLVRLQKRWASSPEALIAGLESECKKPEHDYVDGVALSDHGGMIITAQFAKDVPHGTAVQKYGMWPIFYKSLLVEGEEYMSLEDYIWRWDSDWFWCTQIFPGLSSRIVRWLCGPHMLRSDIYKLFNDAVISYVSGPLRLTKNEELVIQDIDIPAENSAKYIREFLRVVPSVRIGKIKLTRPGLPKAVPMWICPVKGTACPLMPQKAGHLYMNFGFWDALEGKETKGGNSTGRINRALEQLTHELDGRKTLYSNCFFSEEEFYDRYGGDEYKRMKSKYDPDHRLRGWYERLMKS